MQEVHTDATLGKIIFTDKSLSKMKEYGLYRHQIVDALKHGYFVRSIVRGLIQMQYRHAGEKEIGVLFTRKDKEDKPLGAILLVSCWSRNVK